MAYTGPLPLRMRRRLCDHCSWSLRLDGENVQYTESCNRKSVGIVLIICIPCSQSLAYYSHIDQIAIWCIAPSAGCNGAAKEQLRVCQVGANFTPDEAALQPSFLSKPSALLSRIRKLF